MMKQISFNSNDKKIVGNLQIANELGKALVLFFHGGGTANKEKYLLWQKHLQEDGVNSMAIDFVGIGESEGKLEESTISDRISNSVDAIQFIQSISSEDLQLVIVGSSMGGHVGVCTCNHDDCVKGLLLTSPAIYPLGSEDKKFGFEFKRAITESNDYQNSIALSELTAFQGQLMVVYGDDDDVVPNEVKDTYKKECLSRSGNFVEINSAPHKLLVDSTEDGLRIYQDLIKAGDDFLESVFN